MMTRIEEDPNSHAACQPATPSYDATRDPKTAEPPKGGDPIPRRHSVRLLVLVPCLLLVLALACDDSSPIGPSSELISVILVNKCFVVIVGEPCTATARAFGPDGELSNPALFWHSSDPGVFGVTGSTEATVIGSRPGSATMSVGNRSGSVSAETQVSVIPRRE
jgi:hypothetical protein